MTHDEKMLRMEQIFNRCLEVAHSKGLDYSGRVDGMGNFRRHGSYGIVVRLHDKMERLNTLYRSGEGPAVADESASDTLYDLINYAALCLVMRGLEEAG